MKFKIFFCAMFALALLPGICRADKKELSAKEFLKIARYPSGGQYWVKLIGSVMNRRRGADTIEAPLKFVTLFTGKRTIAQIVINKSQGYQIGQVYGVGAEKTSIIPLKKGGYKVPLLGQYGLRPDDLTMSFIYWGFVREEERDTVKMQECRVIVLQSPDGKEYVKVFFSAKHYFPLKVQWFKKSAASAYRNLEVTAYREVDGIYVPSELKLYGPGWRTKVDFDNISVGKDGKIPKDLFQ